MFRPATGAFPDATDGAQRAAAASRAMGEDGWELLLVQLESVHQELEDYILEMEVLTSISNPDRARLANTRWKLTQTSGRRMKLLDEVIYPRLLRFGPPALAARVRGLRDSSAALVAETVRTMGHWTIEGAFADWSGFCRASRASRKALSARIAEERAVLYAPLRLLARNLAV